MAADPDLRIYDSFGHFKLTDGDGDYWLFGYGKGLRVESSVLAKIIHLENLLRETTQRIESLERRMRPIQKLESNNDDLNTLQKYEMEVDELKRLSVNMEAYIILPGIFAKSSLMIAYGGVDVAVGTADAAYIVIYPKTGETEWGLAIVQWNVGAVKFFA
ncbi:hypothetical protein N7519_007580, partial [Penicillium mononematosum]|uniref:uncharacterized protein n=1 Tax=Penicillium mononematosum TaxID=268346 RepID=UPI002547A3F7